MIVIKPARLGILAWLGLLGIAFSARGEDAPGTLADLQKAHEKVMEVIQERGEKARTDAEREAVKAESWAEIKTTARWAFALADAHPDSPEAIDAVLWTVHGLANGVYPEFLGERAHAFAWVTEHALASEKVVPLGYYANGMSFWCPEEIRFLQTALATSPSRLLRGVACLGLARADHGQAHLARRLKDPITRKPFETFWKGSGVIEKLESCDPDALDRQAEATYQRVIDEFGDLKMPYPYNETPFADQARSELYELRDLGVGKVLPEIEGEEISGQKLRLADYRGKVVAIVFWASWCGPCMGMIPHEREMVKRLANKPFVLLGVNGDDERLKAIEVMKTESMTWPSFWNGGKMGGIVDRLGVRAWPTIYVLDAQGVIRYKNVRNEALDEAVDRLIKEQEADRK